MATSSSLRSPCERPPARVRAWASSRKSASTSVASCHTGRSASASDSSRRVLPWREKMASATLSSALSWSKRLTSWNDRAIPARIRSLTGCFVTSWPRKRMWPSSAVSSPLIRLTIVVLPAPLEPMRASTSPSCTRKSTRSTARNSPNCFTTAFVSSSTLIDRRGGPRYGPPASSSEGGYAPLGLPRPSLGRAPAQPWRASDLTQDVSSRGQRQPAVHHERLARDPARLVAGEIDGGPADVPRRALDAERDRPAPALAHLRTEVLDHRSPHRPGRDRVDANRFRRELVRHADDEAEDAGLGRGVRGTPGAADRRHR